MGTVALRDVTKIFSDGTVAVDNLSLDVAAGELMVLLGQYGCGKSTVLRMVAGIEDPSSGAIMLNGVPANEVPAREQRITTRFQDCALRPPDSTDNAASQRWRAAGPPAQGPDRASAAAVAAALGIGDLPGRRPDQLSGGPCPISAGPRQRPVAGRPTARCPGLFLLDEPLSACERGLRPQLRAQLAALVRELGVTTIYVTDDQAEALTMADRVAILRRGVLEDVGTPTQVYNRPATLYAAAFLGGRRMNLLEAYVDAQAGRHIALHLGGQRLHLPWDDTRSRAVAHHHGERVVVGVRAEALAPVGPDTAGNVLRGHVHRLERHGHESLALMEIGGIGIAVDGLGGGPEPHAVPDRSRLRRINQAAQRFAGRVHAAAGRARPAPGPGPAGSTRPGGGVGTAGCGAPSAAASDPAGRGPGGRPPAPGGGCAPSLRGDPGRHRRGPAELAVRLGAQPGCGAGSALAIAVRMDALHFFDEHGRRIDSRWRRA
ncbi:MAG TPA: ABC transporter ATP-binding protein [Micromonosporaceae bacterium]|nr:ABC transporter ATP-binding protein [Micromonosporaceae bacterium]